ncbi:hypothetical protein [Aliiglaciecola sp. LCG003]|uniref:hypothetical protein n=1 Tax=Aliiglaciecola sp. LCG003 TaxID=3053655 RepID=UPI002572516B|nr:hypothetical protein [Aliiglaciecola sp. LCG003]WJG09968.1 hypothetical protein QR722_02725 [Aliiglaciecola sp. LCG003]
MSVSEAQESYLTAGVNWLKSSLPEATKLEFNKSRIKFNGCKHREYKLSLTQPVTENFAIEGGLTYAKGQLNWGVSNQKISLKRYSLVPRYRLNYNMSIAAGLVLQSAPEFKTSQGLELALPTSKIFVLSTRFNDSKDKYQIEIELSSHRWDNNADTTNGLNSGVVNNKMNISYSAFF